MSSTPSGARHWWKRHVIVYRTAVACWQYGSIIGAWPMLSLFGSIQERSALRHVRQIGPDARFVRPRGALTSGCAAVAGGWTIGCQSGGGLGHRSARPMSWRRPIRPSVSVRRGVRTGVGHVIITRTRRRRWCMWPRCRCRRRARHQGYNLSPPGSCCDRGEAPVTITAATAGRASLRGAPATTDPIPLSPSGEAERHEFNYIPVRVGGRAHRQRNVTARTVPAHRRCSFNLRSVAQHLPP